MSSQRAARALDFMQRCRKSSLCQMPKPSSSRRISTSLDPDSFGKKMRIPISVTNSKSTKNRVLPGTPMEEPNFPRSRSTPIPRYRHNPAITPGLFSFIKYRVLRLREPPNPHDFQQPPFNVLTNPYRARKHWPPILSQMSESEQFHYEKKFRRRLLNKTYSMRSSWDTWALFVRRALIGFVIVYFALIYDSSEPNSHLPSDGLRYWLYGVLRKGNEVVVEEDGQLVRKGRAVWPDSMGSWIDRQYGYYKIKHKEQWDPYNHEGWDETRGRNTLPGAAAPPAQQPLGRSVY